ncbi:hypothetical protein HAX54_036475, partial [Datura stramonium]|nr:hypothetical protein [Datura stramonium]
MYMQGTRRGKKKTVAANGGGNSRVEGNADPKPVTKRKCRLAQRIVWEVSGAQVEEEETHSIPISSVWDSFDISKVSNAGFKSEYVNYKT